MISMKHVWGFGDLQSLHIDAYKDNVLLAKLTGSNVDTGKTIEFSSDAPPFSIYHTPVPYGCVYLDNIVGSILKANGVVKGEAEIPLMQMRRGGYSSVLRSDNKILYQLDMMMLPKFVPLSEIEGYKKAYSAGLEKAEKTVKRDNYCDAILAKVNLDEQYDPSADYNFW